MVDGQVQIETCCGLPDALRPRMITLLRLCNEYELLELPISPTDFDSDSGAQTAFAIHTGERLIGFAAMPDDPIPEASLMVDPDFRRRGIGRALVEALRAETGRRNVAHSLLAADLASASATAFLNTLALRRRRTEFRLELDLSRIERARPRIPGLAIRLATPADRQTLIDVLSGAFAAAQADVEHNVDLGLNQPSRDFYLAELDGEAIGAVRLGTGDGNGDITAFGVLPRHQGKGYGRQILLDSIDRLLPMDLPRILIEVAVDNRGALSLYESCGFRIQREYGYFALSAGAA
jgi:ribosomal protein S18 acetylase RimI-like enzyme